MIPAQSDEHEVFSFALAGEEEGARGRATKAHLAGIIRPRVANILGLVRERMDQAGVSAYAGDARGTHRWYERARRAGGVRR